MDRRVKERLIGASVLVVLFVLVVPELLSGPKSAPVRPGLPATAPEPIRNVTVDLATSRSAPTADPEAAANAPSAVQSAPSETAAAIAAPPSSAAAPTLLKPSVETQSAPPTSVGRAAWSVQLGSFASRENAENLTRNLKNKGFAVYVLAGGSGAAARYRVRVGPLSDREAAERTAAKLKSLGHASSLVAPAA